MAPIKRPCSENIGCRRSSLYLKTIYSGNIIRETEGAIRKKVTSVKRKYILSKLSFSLFFLAFQSQGDEGLL